MKHKNQVLRFLVGVFIVAFLAVSCATVTDLRVLFRLPAVSNKLEGHVVFFSMDDARETKEILKGRAKSIFEHFPGNIVYSIAKQNEAGFRLGPYEVKDMVSDGFRRSFENMGLKVLHNAEPGVPELKVVLQEFSLDFAKKNWVGKMRYEARLMKEGKILATQGISAEAEKYRVVGTKAADKTVGELFTDAVNRLDVARLLDQARLL